MTVERIKEIQLNTGYPDSVPVQQALLQVWKEVAQENNQVQAGVMQKIAEDIEIMKNAQLKTIDDYIKDIEDKTIVDVNKKIRDIVRITYDSVIKYVSNFSA